MVITASNKTVCIDRKLMTRVSLLASIINFEFDTLC